MRCVSRKYGVYEPVGYLDVSGYGYTVFDDHGTERLFKVEDISFTPVDKLTKGKML